MKRKQSRRTFLELGLKAGVALPFLTPMLAACEPGQERAASEAGTVIKPLKLLILGGTSFLGPHQIAYALERGHSISTFTRGKTKPAIHQELFDQVEQLVGDREDDLSALEGREWDAVIDNSGHNVEWTRKSAELLKDRCKLYLYTSSTGVFYPYVDSDFTEGAEVNLVEPEGITDEDEKLEFWYGTMKAKSEIAAIEQFGKGRTIVVRPTYMIGPADKSDRFIHWPIRLQRGGEVMVPGKAEDMVQYADVRDVAEFMIRLIEAGDTGTFNAAGPATEQNIYAFVEQASEAFSAKSTFVKIDDYDFLAEQDILHLVPWIMPVGANQGSALIDNQKGIQHGLTFRPLVDTVKDTYDWWVSDAVSQAHRDAVASEPTSLLMREKAILKTWRAR